MHLLFFTLVTICIGGSISQETAISTEYLRTNINDTISSESAIHGQIQDPPPIVPAAVEPEPIPPSTTGSTTTDDDNSAEHDNDKQKSYDHEHKTHHEHEAKITVDVHNILDLFKNQLHETEERILAALKHHAHDHDHAHEHHTSSAPAPIVKSYRIADR